jgi:hypothetical protein
MNDERKVPRRGLLRQGDVLLVPLELDELVITRLERRGNVVLARGEATGHAHRIVDPRAELRITPWERILVVHGDEPVTLEHEEHDPIAVAPGAWEIRRQREYAPAGPGWVSD